MRKLKFGNFLIVAAVWALGCKSMPEEIVEIPSEPIEVEIKNEGGAYSLLRDGQPYQIKGAGFEFGDMETLAAHGANSFRTWRTTNAQQVLDKALANGLTVAMCLDVKRERHGFDYDDSIAVQLQFQMLEKEVLKYKDHPALLMWIIGNELNHHYKNPKVYDAVNDISKMIHAVDPYHPTTTTVAGINKDLADVINERASDIDLLSIQLYGDLVNLPKYIEDTGWKKPYMVTEWGAIGHWEVGKTEWGAPIENTSSVKADNYLKGYRDVITPLADQCIGSYVFLWGQKQERTPTWYGMFLQNGEETESIDVMHQVWNGEWPANRVPRLESVQLDGKQAVDNIYLQSGMNYSAMAMVKDFENDPLSYKWEIKPESTETTEGGDHEADIASLDGLMGEDDAEEVKFTAPDASGAYRLFVYAFDGNNNAAHANIPFYVNK